MENIYKKHLLKADLRLTLQEMLNKKFVSKKYMYELIKDTVHNTKSFMVSPTCRFDQARGQLAYLLNTKIMDEAYIDDSYTDRKKRAIDEVYELINLP